MKTYKLLVAGMLGVALSVMPVFAQRGGGVSRSSSSSSSVSRSSGGFSGSSRSSSSYSGSSRSSSSYSAPRSSSRSSSSYSSPRSSYRSSSSSRSNSSYSSPSSSSRSNYSNSYRNSRSNYSTGSRSNMSSSRSNSGVNSSSAYRSGSSTSSRSSAIGSSRSSSSSPISRSAAMAASRSQSAVAGVRGNSSVTGGRGNSSVTGSRTGSVTNSRGTGNVASRSNSGITSSRSNSAVSSGRPTDNGRPSGSPNRPLVNEYARPGHPGVLPPSSVAIHPAPYFYCPYYDAVLYMNLVPWYAPVVVRPIYWPGFWLYCNSYWYDYHPTDVVVVREYVDRTYGVDLIAYAISGPYMYALVNDNDGYTYLQVFDENDRLLAEQQVHRKYRDMQIDRDNGGCWITKKNGKDPLLFFYTDGQLLIYETE